MNDPAGTYLPVYRHRGRHRGVDSEATSHLKYPAVQPRHGRHEKHEVVRGNE